MKTGPKPRPVAERFWEKVRKRSGHQCWMWQGSTLPKGYGMFCMAESRPTPAHRCAWILCRGQIPKGMHVLHRCDQPGCCNPRHLFLGTNRDNIADRVRKGRSAKGRRHWTARHPEWVKRGEERPLSKLTVRAVRAIRRGLRLGTSQKKLAERFGISRSAVYSVKARRSWRHVR
jgi:predicted DNA-binding protein (UPF0251 family)